MWGIRFFRWTILTLPLKWLLRIVNLHWMLVLFMLFNIIFESFVCFWSESWVFLRSFNLFSWFNWAYSSISILLISWSCSDVWTFPYLCSSHTTSIVDRLRLNSSISSNETNHVLLRIWEFEIVFNTFAIND